MTPKARIELAKQSFERRSWMQWMAGASVVSLSRLITGCGDDNAASADPGQDSGPWDSGAGDAPLDAPNDSPLDSPSDAACETQIPFQPGSDTVEPFDKWKINTVDPQELALILKTWSLRIDGLIKSPISLSFADLLCLPRQNQSTDFHCVEGWSVLDVPWNGVHLSTILERVNPLSTASHLTFHCVGGKYLESLPISVALEPKTLLAYGVSEASLPLSHGFPIRLVAPRLLGYKNVKYIERIEITDHPETGFWEQYGYSYEGEVPPERLRPGKY